MFRFDSLRLESARATSAVRVLFLCVVAACSWWTTGSVHAQTVTTCEPTGSTDVLTPSYLVVNRQTPLGRIHDHGAESPLPASLLLTCRGAVGAEIEIETRFLGNNVRSDPFGGQGVLVDSTIPGVGLQVEATTAHNLAAASPITTPAGRDLVIRRATPLPDRVTIAVRAFAAKTGDIDLSTNHKVHQQPLVEVRWRPKGEGAWSSSVFRFHDIPVASPANLRSETCYFGDTPNVPVVRTHRLRTLATGTLRGVGSEWLAYLGVDNNLVLNCRNFSGGRLSVDSPTRHPTLPGVLRNARTGADAATGIGLRVRDGGTNAPWDFTQPWPLDAAADSFRTIAYSVHFIQTEELVTPGAFSATVTLTVDYN